MKRPKLSDAEYESLEEDEKAIYNFKIIGDTKYLDTYKTLVGEEQQDDSEKIKETVILNIYERILEKRKAHEEIIGLTTNSVLNAGVIRINPIGKEEVSTRNIDTYKISNTKIGNVKIGKQTKI